MILFLCVFLGRMKENTRNPLHLKSLNHISLLCRSVEESMSFYQNVLGFLPIRRPGSFDFDGAWYTTHSFLGFNYIHTYIHVLMDTLHTWRFSFFLLFLRLFGHGIGIHLLQSPEPEKLLKKTEINPKDNHISFQVPFFSFHFDPILFH